MEYEVPVEKFEAKNVPLRIDFEECNFNNKSVFLKVDNLLGRKQKHVIIQKHQGIFDQSIDINIVPNEFEQLFIKSLKFDVIQSAACFLCSETDIGSLEIPFSSLISTDNVEKEFPVKIYSGANKIHVKIKMSITKPKKKIVNEIKTRKEYKVTKIYKPFSLEVPVDQTVIV